MTTLIQPPFMLYTLRAVPGVRNSPPEPAVHLIEADVSGLDTLRTHTLTPEQARALASDLTAAADAAEPRRHACPICDSRRRAE